ncbi:hypothetical protein DPMN_057535 [Dreissena polymorpha]|uniref:Uncharacterized protein n=1 Tax=Dreissena polymorpha TaxID=45954 RepID=A0A9D4C0A2_DREPO|nr:hypothetical protein DPMN_057535 [Dreissena polymorpha]
MRKQQRAAALLRQAADLLNVNTSDRSTQYQHLHQSLVTTNDNLLKELDETRERPQHEVNQLNWSYRQL